MKVVTLIDPSERLLAAVTRVIKNGYRQTCTSSTCNHFSHDPGYSWVEVEIEDDFEKEIHVYPGTPRTHRWSCLKAEYIEAHTAQGLPANAPQWAFTLDTRRNDGPYCHGEGVTVEQDGPYTVVKLMVANNSCVAMSGWFVERNLFATIDGVSDDTKAYRKMRFERLRENEVSRYKAAGLNQSEAERLFKIGKDQWTREQESILIENAPLLRNLRSYLRDLAVTVARKRQMYFARPAGLADIVSAMSSPRTQAFATKALWVFYGQKPNGETEELVSSTAPDTRSPLVSLGEAFSKALAS